MPKPPGYQGRCGCRVGEKPEDQFKTCPKHEIIFRRKCGHADSTRNYCPITTIECRECFGRSTWSKAWELGSQLREAMDKVRRYERNLTEIREVGLSGKYTEREVQEWTEQREILIESTKPMLRDVTQEFKRNYGNYDWRHWGSKVRENVAVDAKVFEGKDMICYFKKRPDDLPKEQAKAILGNISGSPHEFLKTSEAETPSEVLETSEAETSSFSSLYELYFGEI